MFATLKRRMARVFLRELHSAATSTTPPLPKLRVVEEATRDVDTVLLSLNTTPHGLNRAEALFRRTEYGLNEVAHEKAPRWYIQLLHAFANPFILLLLVLAIISALTEEYKSAVIIAVMVLISVLLRFVQEYRSGRAAEKLKALVGTTATVSRRDMRKDVPETVTTMNGDRLRSRGEIHEEIPIKDLVPGDVIHLSAGDMVPADVRLLFSKDLFVSQSILTGESLPVEKYDVLGAVAEKDALAAARKGGSPLDLSTVCFMGTNVISGTARAVVVATGDRTYFGSLARHILG